jgi:hypothetical protein
MSGKSDREEDSDENPGDSEKKPKYAKSKASRSEKELKWREGEHKLMEIMLKFCLDRVAYVFLIEGFSV